MRATLAIVAALAAAGTDAAAQTPASALFGRAAAPAQGPAAALGGHSAGCLQGAVELPESGPGWQTMRPGRNRAWGHPEAIAFIARLGGQAQALGWPRLLVGDISQPRGGPMPFGHASHQTGLDIDIWLTRPGARPFTRAERETVSAVAKVAPDRRRVSRDWDEGHARLLRAAASDPAVARIFVNAAIKAELCRWAPAQDRAWLRTVRPWWGHDHHFHVRLRCPDGAGCVDQDPPPPGDGCDAALDWWFSEEALAPPPAPPKPRAPLTLADLPAACAGVLAR